MVFKCILYMALAGVLCLANQAKEKSAYSIAEKALRSGDTQKALKY